MKPCTRRSRVFQCSRCVAVLLAWQLAYVAFLGPSTPEGQPHQSFLSECGRRKILNSGAFGAWMLLTFPAHATFENALPEVVKFAGLLAALGNSMKLLLVQRMLRTQARSIIILEQDALNKLPCAQCRCCVPRWRLRAAAQSCMSSTGACEEEASRISVAVRCRPLSNSEKNNEVVDICRVMDQRLVILLDPGAASTDYLRHDKSKEKLAD
eukprot:g16456.t1